MTDMTIDPTPGCTCHDLTTYAPCPWHAPMTWAPIPTSSSRLSDEDVDRIARRVAELLRE